MPAMSLGMTIRQSHDIVTSETSKHFFAMSELVQEKAEARKLLSFEVNVNSLMVSTRHQIVWSSSIPPKACAILVRIQMVNAPSDCLSVELVGEYSLSGPTVAFRR